MYNNKLDTVEILTIGIGDSTSLPHSQTTLSAFLKQNFMRKSYLACCHDNYIEIFDYHSEELLETLHEETKAMFFLSEHEFVFTSDSRITIYNLHTKQRRSHDVHHGLYYYQYVLVKNKLLLCFNDINESFMLQWDLETNEKTNIYFSHYFYSIDILNHKTLVCLCEHSTKLCEYETEEVTASQEIEGYVLNVTGMTNTEYIVSCDSGIYLVDVETNTKKFFEMDVRALAKRVNQRTLLLEKCYPSATVIVLFDIRTGVETNVLETAQTPDRIPPRLVYKNCYYFLNPDNQVEVINLDTKRRDKVFRQVKYLDLIAVWK